MRPQNAWPSLAERGYFTRQDFIFDAENDHYTCPAGAKLTRGAERLDRKDDIDHLPDLHGWRPRRWSAKWSRMTEHRKARNYIKTNSSLQSSPMAEEIDKRKGDADGHQAADQHYEHPHPARTLASRVRGYDLRAVHVIVMRRRLDVIQLNRVVAIGLDFHGLAPFLTRTAAQSAAVSLPT
jgi:hypothetical protein